MAADLTATTQGRAWPCLPHPVTGFRGPGRTGDCCPQVTLEALRTFARLPRRQRPDGLLAVARVALRAWRVAGAAAVHVRARSQVQDRQVAGHLVRRRHHAGCAGPLPGAVA